ncbi:hypothetical protein B0H11DRAFT_1916920 [Mycena galericulata]|nr:hypothetical protein B0H11DRAFT_1916920 [Mycena galericulata]
MQPGSELLRHRELLHHHALRRAARRDRTPAQSRESAVRRRVQHGFVPRERSRLRAGPRRAHDAARVHAVPQPHENEGPRAGMVLVTNAAFLNGAGGSTLLGQHARYWAHKTWIDWCLVAEKVNLPGAREIPPVHVASTSEVVARTGLRINVDAEFPALLGQARSSRTEVSGVWKGGSSQPEAGPARRVLHVAMSGPASVRPPGKAVAQGAAITRKIYLTSKFLSQRAEGGPSLPRDGKIAYIRKFLSDRTRLPVG